jgi:transcriptional regulator with XRE-family HTH domain
MQELSAEGIRITLGRNLKKYRQRKKLSQLALANKADLAHNFINDIENNRKWVSPETLARLAAVLEVEPYEFLLPESSEKKTEAEMFTGYLDDLTDSFNKIVGEARGRYLHETTEDS